MANNDLPIRFTENKYCTKTEVSKELKMSLIDNIWSNILAYRSNFNRYLSVKSIEKNQLVICYCPTIASNINALDAKLIRIMREYMRLSPATGELKQFEDACFMKSLQALAKEYQLDASEPYLRSLVQGDVREISSTHRVLLHYLNALKYIKEKSQDNIDIDFLADLYSKLTGNSELTTFYRTTEDKNPENRVIIDRIYTCAPINSIDPMMNDLFNFIENGQFSGLVKAIVSYYYINYIRPFAAYSDEVALLLAKAVLAHSDLADFGALIPLESLLSENQETIAKLFIEVQKTFDLTYFLTFALRFINETSDKILDYLANHEAVEMKQDYYQLDAEEVTPAPAPVAQPAPAVAPVVPPQEIKPAPVVATTPIPVVEAKPQVVRQEPVQQQVVETTNILPVQAVEVPEEKMAVSYIPPVIDEKQACRLEEHLLELDPSLKRKEAHFYARHCTLGKNYTIAQCKRNLGCAYETARTSMDHLVALGYYRKDMVKNKNVYIPIPKKD